MKKIRSYFLIVLIVSILLFLKFTFFPTEKVKGSTNSKGEKKTATSPVTVFVPKDEQLQDKLYASGTILANESAELRAEASGNIVFMDLNEGKTVTPGTLLLKVNDGSIRAQFDKIKVEIKLASEIESRHNKLLSGGIVSQEEYDITLAKYNSLKADSAYYQAEIAKTEVHAPFTGVLGIRKVSIGAYITPAMVIASIYQTNPIKVEFSLPEKYASIFKGGDTISFHTDGSNKNFTGKITVKDPQVDLASRSVHYIAISANPEEELLPGAFVRVELLLTNKSSTLFVPTEAIIPVLKGKKVFVVKDGLAEEKYVETGLRTEDHIQILSGLAVGDSVIINGNYQLKKGAKVKVLSDKKKKQLK